MASRTGDPRIPDTQATRPRRARAARPGVQRYSVAHFLTALILLFVITPFLEAMTSGDAVTAIAMTVVLASAVLAVGGRRRTLAWGVALVVPAIAAEWIDRFFPDAVSPVVISGAGLVFVAFIITQLSLFIARESRVGSDVLCAAVAIYLLIALLWATAYSLVEELAPGSFMIQATPGLDASMQGFNAVYFSVMTLTTAGYGDITPVTGPARMLAMLEAMVGIFYVALLVARLMTMYSANVARARLAAFSREALSTGSDPQENEDQ